MVTEKYNRPRFLFLLTAVVIALTCSPAHSSSKDRKKKPAFEPALYLISPPTLTSQPPVTDANYPPAVKPNLVVVTHGWYENKPWPRDLALSIAAKVDSQNWLCAWFDWRSQSRSINPTDAAKYARDTAAPLLADKILGLSKDFRHIHLIGHSAGSWLISEAARIISSKTTAAIHLTFLDAYVPPFWDQRDIGGFCTDPNVTCWADHYFTHDITLGATEKHLSCAHNVNITKVTPGLYDHKFPHYWYHATVIGSYAPGRRYENKKLFSAHNGIEYGFARSLEAGPENYKTSIKLPTGNKPVKIKRPKKPRSRKLKKLFKMPNK